MENLRRYLLSENFDMNNFKHVIDFKDGNNNNLSSSNNHLSVLFRLPYIRLKNILNVFFYESNRITCFFIAINCIILTMSELVLLVDFLRTLIA